MKVRRENKSGKNREKEQLNFRMSVTTPPHFFLFSFKSFTPYINSLTRPTARTTFYNHHFRIHFIKKKKKKEENEVDRDDRQAQEVAMSRYDSFFIYIHLA